MMLLQRNIQLVRDMVGNPISSTAVRNEMEAGFSIRQLVPDTVVDYIVDNDLFNYSRQK